MRLIVASSNQGKINEIKNALDSIDIVSYFDLMDKVDIVEDGNTYEENALIKALFVYEALKDEMRDDDFILSDDSGIDIKELDGEPGIYSARYANYTKNGKEVIASDIDNVDKVIANLKSKNVQKSEAFYTSALVLVDKNKNNQCFLGYMQGDVILEKRGNNGFGYDPIFIPKNYNKTLGEMSLEEKQKISHRNQSIQKMKNYLKDIK